MMIQLNSKQIIKIALVVLAGLVVMGSIVCIIFWANHGWLTLNKSLDTTIKSVSYCETVCSNPVTTTETHLLLEKGEYFLQVTANNGASYAADVSVDGYFATTTVTPKLALYTTTPFATSVQQYVFPAHNGYFTYETDSKSYSGDVLSSLNADGFAVVGYIGKQTLLLVETTYVAMLENSRPQRIFSYNIATSVVTEIGTTKGAQISPENTYCGSDAMYAISSATLPAKFITMSASGVTTIDIPTDITHANSNGMPVFAASNNRVAFVATDSTGKTTLSVYSLTDFSRIKQFELTANTDVHSLSLSPDGSSVMTLSTEQPSVLYTIDTGQKHMQLPVGNTVHWLDNESFVYQFDTDRNTSSTSTLYLVNIKNKELYGLTNNEILAVYSVSAVIDNKVYFTAQPKQLRDQQTAPAGFVIDLQKELSSSFAMTEKNSIMTLLPYEGMTYSIGYHFDENSKVILDITAGGGARNSAIEKINELGYDAGDYTIVFRDYTSPFTATTGGDQ